MTTPDWHGPRTRRVVTLALLVIAAGIWLRQAWMSDDAYITMRTVRNILDGFGPVWNLGERVQVYTHPLWMMLLTLTAGVTREFYFTPLALSAVLSLAAIWVMVHVLAADWLAAVVGGLLLLFSKSFVDYTASGLENPLTYLLLAAFIWRYRRPADSPRQVLWLTLLAALAALNRADTLLLFVPALLYVAWQQRRQWLRVLGEGFVGGLPLLAWAVFAVAFYGFLMPNTYYAKLNTGIPLAEMTQQGFFYLLELSSADPLTLLVVVFGLTLPWLLRQPRLGWLALGSVLYTVYVVRIGGDFMSGRMLTGPFVVAVACIIQQPLLPLPRMQTGLMVLGVLLLGFANQLQTPWFADATYHLPRVDNKGIADERGHYAQRFGLQTTNRINRPNVTGLVDGSRQAQLTVNGNVGYLGFTASPYTYIVDTLALTDPLLARLPTLERSDWRIGHLERHIPAGYLRTRRTGENYLRDPQLAEYFRRLEVVVSGPLWTRERWAEIWRFQTGANDDLIDRFFYAHPTMKTLDWVHFEQSYPDRVTFAAQFGKEVVRGTDFGTEGLTINLGGLRHEQLLDLSLDLDLFDVEFRNDTLPPGEQRVGFQSIAYAPLRLGEEQYTVVVVDPATAAAGYTQVRLLPKLPGRWQLTRVALTDSTARPVMGETPAHLFDVWRLYYYFFFRSMHEARAVALDGLRGALAAAPTAQWDDLPIAYRLDMLRLTDPTLHPIVNAQLTGALELSDATGRPLLRYLGMVPDDVPADAEETGVRMRLYFEVYERLPDMYQLWFYMKNQETEREYMIYDYDAVKSTAEWPTDVIHEVPIVLLLEPGEYHVTFGLWTPDRRRLYVDQPNDVYWVDMGVLTAPEVEDDEAVEEVVAPEPVSR